MFIDAAIPPAEGRAATAPATFADFLAKLADSDGVLPPWTTWWDEADVAGLFPDGAVRVLVEREQHRLPLSYFTDTVPVPAGWDERPGAYLAFGDTYAQDRDHAAERGWPVRTVPGGHLHMLVDPIGVAAQIEDLLRRVGLERGG